MRPQAAWEPARRAGAGVEIRRARSEEERAAALALRHRVFCEEQGVPFGLDRDGRDEEAVHLIAVQGAGVIGTCRLVFDGPTAKLGRMAVEPSARRSGLGARLLVAAEREARSAGAEQIALHSQAHARALYETHGFEARGKTFLEAGIEHVAMEKPIA